MEADPKIDPEEDPKMDPEEDPEKDPEEDPEMDYERDPEEDPEEDPEDVPYGSTEVPPPAHGTMRVDTHRGIVEGLMEQLAAAQSRVTELEEVLDLERSARPVFLGGFVCETPAQARREIMDIEMRARTQLWLTTEGDTIPIIEAGMILSNTMRRVRNLTRGWD